MSQLFYFYIIIYYLYCFDFVDELSILPLQGTDCSVWSVMQTLFLYIAAIVPIKLVHSLHLPARASNLTTQLGISTRSVWSFCKSTFDEVPAPKSSYRRKSLKNSQVLIAKIRGNWPMVQPVSSIPPFRPCTPRFLRK